ncbi:LRR domain containing protein [Parasponia andersonii]|uniref:LRR domain containing protein n=1 Tax=Parasponia andersonii TaxID=3476 RepID=A0A2P5BP99_PARAD|nr:LRR domain containing protein [Parasponia andersonii]
MAALSEYHNSSSRYLDLSMNELEGNLPDYIGSFQNLEYLALTKNSFSGSIPASIGNLSHLWMLDLSFNKLSGTIPESIGYGELSNSIHFSSKVYLSIQLGFNCLEGSLPLWTNVTYLSLRNNLLSGPIPSNIGHEMSTWLNLDLSRNYINGSIPPFIKELRDLASLDLSFNHLSGEIFERLMGLDKLQFLDLSNNNLSGGIPTSMCLRLPSIYWLKLSDNSLSGSFLHPCRTALT